MDRAHARVLVHLLLERSEELVAVHQQDVELGLLRVVHAVQDFAGTVQLGLRPVRLVNLATQV